MNNQFDTYKVPSPQEPKFLSRFKLKLNSEKVREEEAVQKSKFGEQESEGIIVRKGKKMRNSSSMPEIEPRIEES